MEGMCRDDRWTNLVQGAFRLDELGADGEVGRRDVLAFLDSILEVFPESIDPTEDFEGYAVRRSALALREALTPGR